MPGPKVDQLIGRVIEAARDVILKGAATLRETEERRKRSCLLVIDGSDPIALRFYQHCLLAGMQGPPTLKQRVVTTLLEPYDGVMTVATAHYRSAEHVDPPLQADEVRAVVLTLGTLTVVRLDERCEPRFASPSYHPLRPDVLVVAVCCWRNDRPEGFLVNAVFSTRAQGEQFLARIAAQRAALDASMPTKDAIEEELLRYKPSYRGRPVPPDVEARLYAQVGWLEDRGQLPANSFNGVVFTFGCEMQLEDARELARTLGGPKDDLS